LFLDEFALARDATMSTTVNWGIVPFRLKLNYITPDPPGYEPIGHAYLRQMFTGEGAGQGNLVDYFLDVSHGKLDISGSKVFPWLDLPSDTFTLGSYYLWSQYYPKLESLTASGIPEEQAGWMAGTMANAVLRKFIKGLARDEIKKVGLDVSSYFGLIFVVSSFLDPREFLVIADNSPRDDRLFGLDLSGVASEMGHGLGLEDSVRQNASAERTDYWDLMSVYGPRLGFPGDFDKKETAYFAQGNVRPSASPPLPFTRHGPGLNAANMQVMGWLDNSRVVTVGRADTVVLRPLHRRDLPGHLAARVGSYLLEFRMNERWDVGIPQPCILMHEVGWQSATGKARSELIVAHKSPVSRPELLEGDVFEKGDPLDLFSSHLKIRVEEINPGTRVARISVSLRPPRQPPSVRTFGGVDVGGGGLIWTPGRGFKKVPPDSPLRGVLELVAALESLSERVVGESGDDQQRLRQAMDEQLQQLRVAVDQAVRALGNG
jgi:hypothetical protein